jgi:GNAT superfamily N-acetyltransferase
MIKTSSCSQDEYAALVNIHNSLNIVWPEAPRSPQAWAEADRTRDPKSIHQRWVATNDGGVIGFASFSHPAWDYHPRRFSINVEVHPNYQNRGIGSALYEQVMEGLSPLHPLVLRADAFTNLPQGFRFLQKRGFYEAFRETPVHLEVASFDPSPYAGLEPKLIAQGIFIKTVRELECDPERDRKIYNLYWEVSQDVPHEDTEEEKPSFEDWLSWGLNPASTLADAYFIATYGDRYIGLRELYKHTDNTALLGSLLGVRRAYRGRGIGMAMQLRSIAYAREHGYSQLNTCTAVQNAPMQAMFTKLGYARDPEWQQCQKDIR